MKYLVKYEVKGKSRSVEVIAYRSEAAIQAVRDSYDYPIDVKSIKKI